MNLENFSIEEMQEEIQRREVEARRAGKPEVLKDINWTPVVELCEKYVKQIVEEVEEEGSYYDDSDWDNYIYEATLDAVFGEGFWPWFNKQVD